MTIGPVVLIVTLLQFTIIQMPWEIFLNFLIGSVMVMTGLIVLLQGLKIGIMPVGELIGSALSGKGSVALFLLLGFLLGFGITIAEPSVLVLSSQVQTVLNGEVERTILIMTIGIGAGLFILISFLRIILKIPIIYLLMGGYFIIFILSFFSERSFIAIGFDAGGTTGAVSEPFIKALGFGLTYVLGGRSKGLESFGFIGLGSMGPIITILVLGVIYN